MLNKDKTIIDYYIDKYYPDVDINNEVYQTYYDTAIQMLKHSNFMLFPHKGIVRKIKNNVDGRTYVCDLIIQDDDFGGGIIEKQIEINQAKHLQNYGTFKTFIQLQDTRIKLEVPKSLREKYCDLVIRSMLGGYEAVFGLPTGFEIESLGFTEDGNKFVFNNGILNLEDGSFEKNDYTLSQSVDINITYPEEEVNKIDIHQCLIDLQSVEKYISPNRTISSLVLGYMVGGLFRYEYQKIRNEFPFLGMEGYTGLGKTSLLNFLSWMAGYNWKTIPVGDTEFASEVAMNSISGGFHFVDEIQKVSNKMLNLMQASYNSGKSHKGGAEGDRSKIQVYKKDCSLVCFGEVLPYHDEAFLNRFLILNPTEPFLVKKLVKDVSEFQKYYELTGTTVTSEYLTTEQIKTLAIDYYRPRFMALLKNKKNIDFTSYHTLAMSLIEKTVGSDVDTRLKNNLSLAITGYLMLLGEDYDDNNIMEIIRDYFSKLKRYRSKSIISGKLVDNIVSNPDKFCSWLDKVKFGKSNPRIYVKHTDTEKGMYIKLKEIAEDAKDTLECQLKTSHIIQQLMSLLGLNDNNSYNKAVCVAGGDIKVDTKWVPLATIQQNDYLQKIWDVALEYSYEHIGELNQLINEKKDTSMQKTTLEKLSNEMITTYFSASFFDQKKREEHEKLKKELEKLETTI